MVSLTVGSNTNLYALTRTGEVLESLDGGTVWTPVGTIPVSAAVEIRRRDVNLYVLTATGVTYESTNDGATWAAVGTVSQVGIAGLCTTANRLVAVTKEGLVARTTDGAAWTWVGTVNQLQVLALANDYPTLTGVLETPPVLGHLVMAPPYPNPLATGRSLAIRFELPDPDVVRLDLFDASGRRIADRSPKSFSSSGVHVVNWRPNVAPGVYFLRLSTDRGLTANRRVIVLP
jgi:hypothetical protein